MGKKNKNRGQNDEKKNLEVTEQKGGSAINKNNKQSPSGGAKAQNNNEKTNKQAVVNIKQKEVKEIDDAVMKDIGAELSSKNKKKQKKNKKKGAAAQNNASPQKTGPDSAKETKNANPRTEFATLEGLKVELAREKLNKDHPKRRLKELEYLTKLMAKLEAKKDLPEDVKRRKIALFAKAFKKATKNKEPEKKPAKGKGGDNGDEVEMSDEDKSKASNGQQKGASPGGEKKGKKKNKGGAEKAVNGGQTGGKKEQDKNFLFVGNLPKDITEEGIRDHFKSAGTLLVVRIPVPRRKKSKRFAYIKCSDKEMQQVALELHGSTVGEKKITVLYSDMSKGKSSLMSENAKLNALRKAASENPAEAMLKSKKKKHKAKKVVGAEN